MGCTLADSTSCVSTAMYYTDKGDAKKASDYRARACRIQPIECRAAAYSLLTGKETDEEHALALTLMRRSCFEGKARESCVEACNLGVADACNR